MTAFSDLLREHLKNEYLTVHGVAERWQLKTETITGLLTGKLTPNGQRHVSFFAREFGVTEDLVREVLTDNTAKTAKTAKQIVDDAALLQEMSHFDTIMRMLKKDDK